VPNNPLYHPDKISFRRSYEHGVGYSKKGILDSYYA